MEVYINLENLEDITNNALLKISRKNGKPEIVEIVELQSLAEHDKQIRKEVCEILDKRIHNYLSNKCRYAESLDVHSIIKQVIKEELDQIQGETNGSKN